MTGGETGSDETPKVGVRQHYTLEDAEVAKSASDNQAAVEQRRATMGLCAVLASDVAIAVAAIIGVLIIRNHSASSTAVVSVLSSAFTAVGTLTTAYFGIKASANTAKNSIASQQDSSPGPQS
jgi:arginine exporter protein ArgO